MVFLCAGCNDQPGGGFGNECDNLRVAAPHEVARKGGGDMGRFDLSTVMTDAWRVWNNMFVSMAPLTAALIGISLFGLALGVIFYIVRRATG